MAEGKSIQCPNCGGYKVQIGFTRGDATLTLLTGGIYAIGKLVLSSKTNGTLIPQNSF